MNGLQRTPESPETGPHVSTIAGTAKNPRNAFSPLRKALAAAVVGLLLLTGAGIGSLGFTADAAAAAPRTHADSVSSGVMNAHNGNGTGGLLDGTKGVPATVVAKTDPAVILMDDKRDPSTRVGTVSIPRFGSHWSRYLVEGATNIQVDLPGTDNPNAVADFETAIGHNTGTQRIGDLGNAVIEGHRTPNTFGPLDTLQLGDTISITDATTGAVYVYAVTQTIRELPYRTKAERNHAVSAMNPVPFDDASLLPADDPAAHPATKRLLTMTSCGADVATTRDFRVYVQAELQSVMPGNAVK